jgi:tRNA nucleotidyltransferase/poly(A) polymerase
MRARGERSVPDLISKRVLRALRNRKPLWRFLHAFCRAVEKDGGKAYLAGGFVRDLVEGRPGNDIDLMVAGMEFARLGMLLRSLPAKRLGIRRIVPVGKAFAVYKVRADWADDDVDVAPARSSSRSTGPERRGFELRAGDADAREDAARRDFTINSLLIALHTEKRRLTGSVLDFFGGLADLRRRLIRGVGKPEERFREDPLRLLRAIRQKNERRGYTIEKETRAAIRRLAPEIFRRIPGERAIAELLRSLSANPSGSIEDLRRSGILSILLPDPGSGDRRFVRILRRYAILEKSLGRPLPEAPLLANLLVDAARAECDARIRSAFPKGSRNRAPVLSKEDEKKIFRLSRTDAVARRLHFPRIRTVVRMLEDLARLTHSVRLRNRDARIEAIFGRWKPSDGLLSLYRADRKASGRKEADFRPILEAATHRPQILSGKDLLKLGIPASPRMKEILEDVREATITGKVDGKEDELDLALSIYGGLPRGQTIGPRFNPRARRATRRAGFPAATGREGGRKKTTEKRARRSPGRSG